MNRTITPAPLRKTVRVKVPPMRLVLAWQVGGHWRFDPDLITEIELRFTPDGTETLVELEHRQLERLGDAAAVIASDCGWTALIEAFASDAAAAEDARQDRR